MCRVIAKEIRCITTVDLPGFFLHAERDVEELILLKLTGTIALLLVESDERKWQKFLVRESGKWVVHATHDKGSHGAMNAALLACKKFAKAFKSWDFAINH